MLILHIRSRHQRKVIVSADERLRLLEEDWTIWDPTYTYAWVLLTQAELSFQHPGVTTLFDSVRIARYARWRSKRLYDIFRIRCEGKINFTHSYKCHLLWRDTRRPYQDAQPSRYEKVYCTLA